MTSRWEEIKVDSNPMKLYISHPDGVGPFPAIVLIQHQGGVDKFMEEMTDRVAAAGYFGVAPDLYHRDAPDCQDDGPTRRSRLRDVTVIKDVNSTVDFLKGHRLVDGERLGITGCCMGGRVAYLMAAANPSFSASVPYYGGNVDKAWGDGPSPFERFAEIHCPILGHYGEEDKNPSPEDMRRQDTELTKLGKAHEFYSYRGAGHAFMDRHGHNYNAQADQASWPRTLDFFRRCLIEVAPKRAAASR